MMKFTRQACLLLLALAVAQGPAWAGGDPAAGASKASACAGCHGTAGEGNAANPPIAGLDAEEHYQMLVEYQAGERGEAMMQLIAGQLTEKDMADIAAYYASLGQ